MLSTIVWKQQVPTEPLVFRSFLNVWGDKYPTLGMQKYGSDLCDRCTQLRNNIFAALDLETKIFLLIARQCHRHNVEVEYRTYKDM